MEIKVFKHNGEVKGLKEGSNGRTVYGYCNVKNVRDAVGDVAVDGCYKGLDDTLRTGFFAANHKWDEPIGYFTVIKEDQVGLYFEAELHSTEKANEFLSIITERVKAGKSVGVSIGYRVNESEPGVWEDMPSTLLKDIRVKEASFTLVPVNELAGIAGTKSRTEQFEDWIAETESYLTRVKEIAELGRSDSWKKNTAAELSRIKSAIDAFLAELHPDEAAEPLVEEGQKTDPGAVELMKSEALAAITAAQSALRK